MSVRPESPAGEVLDALRSRLADSSADPTLDLRVETADDLSVSGQIYASTRMAEMALVDWPEAQKKAFVDQQFQAQHRHYRQHYPNAAFLMVVQDGKPVGRLYVNLGRREVRLMDIILLPTWRGLGLGRQLLHAVVALARDHEVELTLHVEPDNPARRWYERLGFECIEERGIYWFMRLATADFKEAQLKLI